jgi:hypothetical protein
MAADLRRPRADGEEADAGAQGEPAEWSPGEPGTGSEAPEESRQDF